MTVWGSNLLMQPSDIINGTTIAGMDCVVQQHDFDISTRFVCRTGYSGRERMGPVTLTRKGSRRTLKTKSSEPFHYLDPQILQIVPLIGPRAGGTRLKITGRNLNVGGKIQAFLDDLPCDVER